MNILDICLFVCSFLDCPESNLISVVLWAEKPGSCSTWSQEPGHKHVAKICQLDASSWDIESGVRETQKPGWFGIDFSDSVMDPVSRGRGGSNINSGVRCILTDPSHDKILAVILGFLKSLDLPVFWILFSSLLIHTVHTVSSPMAFQQILILLLELSVVYCFHTVNHSTLEGYEINLVGMTNI